MAARLHGRRLVEKLTVQSGANAVVAGKIDSLVIHAAPEFIKTPLDPFASVPPLPPAYMDRPDLSEPLIERLLSSSSTVAVTAIEGMGGVGKTIVALGLCHDQRIRKTFPDGIVWLDIGKEASIPLEKRMEYVAKHLNQEFLVYTEAAYRSLLKDKSVLVVLDDVWTIGAVEPFLLDSGKSRLLYTSRDKSLAGPLNADEQQVGVLDDAQGRRFLAKWSGWESNPLPEPFATEILAECKGLVLALAMIGAVLKSQPDREWADMVTDLKKARLKHIGKRPANYAYETLHASIAVSVDALYPDDKVRYLRLAVLLEDMRAPERLLQALWGGEERDVRRVARLFVDRSLARRDAGNNIRLHDLQLDYIRGEHPDQAALALEHSALLLSQHIISFYPEQFASQMTEKLLAHKVQPGIASFLDDLDESAPRPWLRPLWPAHVAAGGPALRVVENKTSWVRAVALSADGKRAVTGSEDHCLRVWDMESDQPPRILEGHTDQIRAVALSIDGKVAISGSEDTTVRIWDLEGSQLPRILRGHTAPVRAIALSGDGRRVVSGSRDKTVRVWDLIGNQPPSVLGGHAGDVNAIALSANGERAASASHDMTLRIWDLGGSQQPRILKGHTERIYAVALSADGKCAVSGSDDKTVRVWDLEGDHPPRILEGHTGPVTAVALSADGQRVVSGSRDKTLRDWDMEGDDPPRVLEGHTGFVNSVALSADGQRAVSASLDRTLRVWDLKRKKPTPFLVGHSGSVRAVALSANGKRAVTGSEDTTIRIWDLEGNQPPRILEGHTKSVTAVALSGDGRRVVSCSADRTMRVWDLEGHQPPRLLEGHKAQIWALALSRDGKHLLSCSEDKTLCFWNLEGNQPACILQSRMGRVWAVALSDDCKCAVSCSGDYTLRVWDLESNQPPRILKGHLSEVRAVALSADGKRAVSGSMDCSVRVWDLTGNRPPRILKGHTGRVHAVALSDDSRRAVSASEDHTLRVWDLTTGKPLSAFRCDAEVLSGAWAGKRILAGDNSGNIHLFAWEE